jgi:hypothetical protein
VQGLPSLPVIVVARLPLLYKKLYEKDDNKKEKPPANLLVVDDDSDIAHVLKQGLLRNGFLVDAFNGYYPDIDGMKKLVKSLSERATKEGRIGVSVIVNMGYFFLYGGDGEASNLISYEASLAPKTDGGNVRGFSCYHAKNYTSLNKTQKKELHAQGQKKSLEVTENVAAAVFGE